MAWSLRLCLFVSLGVLAGDARAADTLLLEFRSPTCGPCREMQPIVDRLAAEGVAVRQVDVTREPGVASQFHVDSWPTFIVLVDGREQARRVGMASREELVRMLGTASANAARARQDDPRGVRASVVTPVAMSSASRGSMTPTTFASGPAAGRIVEIEQPKHRSPTRHANDGGRVNANSAANIVRLLAATVRLSVEDPTGKSKGTGSIVDARNGAALILTCGHIFRASSGKGKIEVTLFSADAAGAHVQTVLPGQIIEHDLDRDLALVMIHPDIPLAVAPIAPPGTQLTPGDEAVAVGCDHGADPTPWPTQITAVNRYQGFPNVEAARAPVEGRSGGGLFNAQGQLVGVCFAAEPRENEGLYASLASIHAKLDELSLSMVYQAPAGVVTSAIAQGGAPIAPDHLLAAAESPMTIRGQSPGAVVPGAHSNPPATSPQVNPFASATPTAAAANVAPPSLRPAALSAADRATLEELQRRGVDAEVICIIRPRTPDGRSEVIKLNAASPALVAAIEAAGRQSVGADAVRAAGVAALPAQGNLFR